MHIAQAQPINCHYYWLTQPLCLTVPDGRYSFSPHTQAHKQQLLLNTLHDRVIQADDFKWRWNSNLKLKTPTKSVYSNLVLLQIDAIRQTAPCRYSCNRLFLLFSWQWSSVWIHCHTSATGWFLPLHCSLTVSVVSQINRSGGGRRAINPINCVTTVRRGECGRHILLQMWELPRLPVSGSFRPKTTHTSQLWYRVLRQRQEASFLRKSHRTM